LTDPATELLIRPEGERGQLARGALHLELARVVEGNRVHGLGG
jgi:hypothetical protein